MLLRLLKKDLKKRKGINSILFVFITLATVFLTSSVNNIIAVSSAVSYFMDYANVPDMNMVLNSDTEKEKIDIWLNEQVKQGNVSTYDHNVLLPLIFKDITVEREGSQITIENKGMSLYLGTQDTEFGKVYDEDGNTFQLKEGEIALSVGYMESTGLQIGDRLNIQSQGIEKKFTIKNKLKDAMFGSDMTDMSRFFISEKDFESFKSSDKVVGLYYVMTPDTPAFYQELNNQHFMTIVNSLSRDQYQMTYAFDMIMAALLILIGICLILIAMLVLRFTLVFTMEEQYQEIGILKAIGLRNRSIKKLYLLKYFAIVSIGALLGLCISIPVSNFMLDSVSKNLIMKNSNLHLGVHVVCAAAVVILVLAFCYFCTRKLNKLSAIAAIRQGGEGERFRKRKGLRLVNRGHMPVFLYLGLNDILHHVRRYLVLICTFCISFILITIPLNTLNTMRSNEMALKFLLDPDSSVYLRNIEQKGEEKYQSLPQLKKGMQRLQKEIKSVGYNAELTSSALYVFLYNGNDVKGSSIMTTQLVGSHTDFLDYEEGSAPELENEIAFSDLALKENGWKIGDTVDIILQNKKLKMLITARYSDYMHLGVSARLNPKLDCSKELLYENWATMVNIDTKDVQLDVEKIEKELPNYSWYSAQELVDQNVGGIQDALDQLLLPMTAMLCGIIMLITLLMERLFITREKGEIAMLKSTGFSHAAICGWQMTRMICVVMIAMILAVPLSYLGNHFVLRPIFAIMGADVNIQVNAVQVYLIYPGVLLAGILVATILGTRSIRNISIHEINNME